MSIEMRRVCGVLAVAAMAMAGAANADRVGPIRWMAPESMAKAELVDAIAKGAKVAEADALGVVDGFTTAVASSLAKGWTLEVRINRWEVAVTDPDSDDDGIPTSTLFGVFSLGDGGVASNGCPVGGEVNFARGAALQTNPYFMSNEMSGEMVDGVFSSGGGNPHYEERPGGGESPLYGGRANGNENPLAKEGGWIESVLEVRPHNGGVAVFGAVEGYFVEGDRVVAHRRGGGVVHRDVAARVVAVVVRGGRGYELAASTVEAVDPVGLLLTGIEKSDIRRGMRIDRVLPDAPDRCERPEEMIDNETLIKMIAGETRLPEGTVRAAYHTMLNLIADIVVNGGFVDIGDFGRFEAETTLTASVVDPCAGIPENCPPADGSVLSPVVDWETRVTMVGASFAEISQIGEELAKLAKRAARTGRNPQTGKEIKIAAKTTAKFKAGKALAETVK